MAEEGDQEKGDDKIAQDFSFVRQSDMPEEMRMETKELCITACEKYPTNNEFASRFIKEAMDEKFNSPWQVVVGESFSFEITHDVQGLFFMFFGGRIAILMWKCL